MTASVGAADQRWWTIEAEGDALPRVHSSVFGIVRQIREDQAYRSDRDLIHMCLYGSDLVDGFGVGSYSLASPTGGAPLSFNVVRSVIDTLVARVVKSKPLPMHLTQGGDWGLQRAAKQLNKYTEGLFYANKVYRLNRQIVRDALVFGTGAARGLEGSVPRIERAFTPEMYVHDAEAKYGDPRSLYHLRTIDKLVAKEKWDEFAEDIERARPAQIDQWTIGTRARDQIEIVEAWHLPSSPSATDGARCVCIENTTLEYDTDGDVDGEFPYATLRYSVPILGWYGKGGAEMLAGKQLEINKLLTEIRRSFHLGSNFRVLVERGSKIIKSHFSNEIGGILEYTGAAPTIAVAQTVHPEKFQHLLWLIDSSFREFGINAMSAAGQKDPTLRSGKAQEVALDVEDSRFAEFQQAYDEFCMDEAELLLALARKSGARTVVYVGKKAVEEVEIPDIKGPTVLQVFPTNALASTPQARMEQVQNLANAGWLSPAQAKRQLDFPELEDEAEIDSAPYDIVRDYLDRMVETGEYLQPLPEMDLEQAMMLANNYYLRARAKWAKKLPEHLDLVLQFEAECKSMLDETEGAAPAQVSGQSEVVGGPAAGAEPPLPPAEGVTA